MASSGSLREDVSSSKMSSLVSVREKERDGPMASVSDTSLGINSNKQAVKPSLSLGDLSMIDKKASDQVSVDSVPVTRKRITKKGKTVQGKMSTPTRLNKRQRSASLDDARVHRGKTIYVVLSPLSHAIDKPVILKLHKKVFIDFLPRKWTIFRQFM